LGNIVVVALAVEHQRFGISTVWKLDIELQPMSSSIWKRVLYNSKSSMPCILFIFFANLAAHLVSLV
jgi:hypothetical protein